MGVTALILFIIHIFYHPNIVIRPFNHINLQHDYACAVKIAIKYEKVETSRPQAIYGHRYPCPALVKLERKQGSGRWAGQCRAGQGRCAKEGLSYSGHMER